MRWLLELFLIAVVVLGLPGVLGLAVAWGQWGKHRQRQGWRALAASHGGTLYDPGSPFFGPFGFAAVAANLTLDLTIDGVAVRVSILPSFVLVGRIHDPTTIGTRHATQFRALLTEGAAPEFLSSGAPLSPALQSLAPAFRTAVIQCDGRTLTVTQPWVIREAQLLESGARLASALARGAR